MQEILIQLNCKQEPRNQDAKNQRIKAKENKVYKRKKTKK